MNPSRIDWPKVTMPSLAHGIGGTIGALLTGVFATMAVKGGDAAVGLIDGNPAQVWIQLKGIVMTMLFCGVGTAIILKVIDLAIGLRVCADANAP